MIEFLKRLFFGDIPLKIYRSMRDEPDTWTLSLTGAYLLHPKRVSVWIANKVSGVHVEKNGAEVWGGVTMFSVFRLSPGHHLIWAAASKILSKDLL